MKARTARGELGPDAGGLARSEEVVGAGGHRVVGAGEDHLGEGEVAELVAAVAPGLADLGLVGAGRPQRPGEGQAAEQQRHRDGRDRAGDPDGEAPRRALEGDRALPRPVDGAEHVEQADGAGHEAEERRGADGDRRRRLRPAHGEEPDGDGGQRGGGPPPGPLQPAPDGVAEGAEA